MRMVLLRHAESEANANGVLQGHIDSPLTDHGRNQARLLAQKLKKAGDSFDSIFSSDLSRASDTAKIVGEALDINSIELTPLLREMDLGILAGKKRKNLNLEEKILLESAWKDHSNRIPNGESINEFISRLKRFINIIELLDPQPISLLVVTHGGSIYHILKSILNVYPAKSEWFGNCKINEIIGSSGNWKIITFNGEIVEF